MLNKTRKSKFHLMFKIMNKLFNQFPKKDNKFNFLLN